MNDKIVKEILDELFSSLEALDTQSAALVQFLKEKGIVSDEELAPHLERAGNASSVRWRAARVRIDYLLASAIKPAEPDAQQSSRKNTKVSQGEHDSRTQTSPTTEAEGAPVGQENAIDSKSTSEAGTTGVQSQDERKPKDTATSGDGAKNAA
jgi:hypothetical protein